MPTYPAIRAGFWTAVVGQILVNSLAGTLSLKIGVPNRPAPFFLHAGVFRPPPFSRRPVYQDSSLKNLVVEDRFLLLSVVVINFQGILEDPRDSTNVVLDLDPLGLRSRTVLGQDYYPTG